MSAPERPQLKVQLERWPLRKPFRIAGHSFIELEVAVVTLQRGDRVGRAEAAGVYYRDDSPGRIAQQLGEFQLHSGVELTHDSVQRLLPPGGARNALDCALWELQARESGVPVWSRAKISPPTPLLTMFTVGADDPAAMAREASAYTQARALKLKLTGEAADADRVKAVRDVRPEVWLAVDANQGLTRRSFEHLYPTLVEADVRLLEQPFPVGMEVEYRELRSAVQVALDESVQGLADLHRLAPLFDVVNIKLDKCGGLTEGLAMAREARALGKKVMIGNMLGTSLAMAPAYVIGQLCDVVDLDGPIFLTRDREHHVTYADGRIHCPPFVWGDA